MALKFFNAKFFELTFHPTVDKINDISYYDFDYWEYNECFKTFMRRNKKTTSESDIEFGLCNGFGYVNTYYPVKFVVNQFCMYDFMHKISPVDYKECFFSKKCKKCKYHHLCEYSNCSILGYFTCNCQNDRPAGLLLKIDDQLIFNFNIDKVFMFDVDSLFSALLSQIGEGPNLPKLDSLVRHHFPIWFNDDDPIYSVWFPIQFFIEDKEFSIPESLGFDEDDEYDDSDDSDCDDCVHTSDNDHFLNPEPDNNQF